jgi:hypothetical protein
MAQAAYANGSRHASSEVEVQVLIDGELQKYTLRASDCSNLTATQVKEAIEKKDARLRGELVFPRAILGQTHKDIEWGEVCRIAILSTTMVCFGLPLLGCVADHQSMHSTVKKFRCSWEGLH